MKKNVWIFAAVGAIFSILIIASSLIASISGISLALTVMTDAK